MKLEEVKAICSHFTPVKGEDGKTRCKYRMADCELCSHPAHFLCDVVSRSKLSPKVLGGVPISMSKVGSWLRCQRSWALHYHFRVDPLVTALPLTLGKMFAAARARVGYGMPWEIPLEEVQRNEAEKAKLDCVLTQYQAFQAAHPADEPKSENEVFIQRELGESQTDGRKLIAIGFADAVRADGNIDEWKYTSNPESYDQLKIALQASAYFYMLPKAKELRLCAARRPKEQMLLATPEEKRKYKKCACKGKKPECSDCSGTGTTKELYSAQRDRDESIPEFKARLIEQLGAKGSFFDYSTYLRGEFDIDGNVETMRKCYHEWCDAQASFRVGEGLRAFRPNYNSCDMCDYREWCLQHSDGKTCGRFLDKDAQMIGDLCKHPQICVAIRTAEEMEASK